MNTSTSVYTGTEIDRRSRIIAEHLTWEILSAFEPKLAELHDEVCGADTDLTDSWFCSDRYWSLVEPRLDALVGPDRPDKDPILSTDEAHDIAIDVVFASRPQCRNCPICTHTTRYHG